MFEEEALGAIERARIGEGIIAWMDNDHMGSGIEMMKLNHLGKESFVVLHMGIKRAIVGFLPRVGVPWCFLLADIQNVGGELVAKMRNDILHFEGLSRVMEYLLLVGVRRIGLEKMVVIWDSVAHLLRAYVSENPMSPLERAR